jgi:hypothetical protein
MMSPLGVSATIATRSTMAHLSLSNDRMKSLNSAPLCSKANPPTTSAVRLTTHAWCFFGSQIDSSAVLQPCALRCEPLSQATFHLV